MVFHTVCGGIVLGVMDRGKGKEGIEGAEDCRWFSEMAFEALRARRKMFGGWENEVVLREGDLLLIR